MILSASSKSKDTVLNRALLIYRDADPNIGPYDVLIQKYVNNKNDFGETTYSRYWHGYLIFLMPLLTIMNYADIRVFNGVVQLSLIIFLIVMLIRRKMYKLILPVLLSYLMLRPQDLACSLQFSSCFYITIIGCLVIIDYEKINISPNLVFLLIGVLLAYFDLLTYPVVTLGLPLTIYMSTMIKI